ncbi:unnamed protein product [Protopolystoma xenopodis]|uniref:Uncharacterized protein n=1 Tax=Protopolystoma xenopodis TaxID=117903 RepID=A0A448WGY2_9PLAT|nr:unnamed protein product [Protopolystoma xenopodis]
MVRVADSTWTVHVAHNPATGLPTSLHSSM